MMALFVALHMTDESLSTLADIQVVILRYICGFPLVMVNTEYPFFLSATSFPKHMIPMVVVNIAIQAILIEIYFRIKRKDENI